MQDQIFPFIREEPPAKQVGYYTVTVAMHKTPDTFGRWISLTYKVKNTHAVEPGQICNVRTPRGIRRITILEIDAIKKDTQPGIEYKFLDEVLVNENQEG